MKLDHGSFKICIPLLAISLCGFTASPTPAPDQQIKKAETPRKSTVSNLDKDLSGYPDYYKKRIIAFRNIIRKSKTRESKIKTAIKILSDENSPYRRESIEFLSDVKAKEAVQDIMKAGEEKDLRTDSAYALGEIKDERSMEFLMRCLYDYNDNVRANASAALKKITHRDFGYLYSDQEDSRNRAARLWENWWAENKNTFKVSEISEEDKKDAEEKWEKYGKPYIERLKNEK